MAARNGQQMSDRRPSVDDAFNIFERAIGERLERWTRSDAFIDGVAAAAQANTVMRRLYDQGTGMLLHMWNERHRPPRRASGCARTTAEGPERAHRTRPPELPVRIGW
jgi:hypothetical protein